MIELIPMNKGRALLTMTIIILSIPAIALFVISERQDRITPNDEFFTVSIGDVPAIDGSTWRLEISGLVTNDLRLTYENFTSLPARTITAKLKCVEGPSGTAVWRGIPLKTLLDQAQIEPGAAEVIFYAADGYSSSLTLKEIDDDVLLAFEMNGETLPADHGFPVRLVVPGKAGYKWVKWITRIEVVDYDYKGYWESRGWSDSADMALYEEWILHAGLLSAVFVLGGLAAVSGLKFSKNTRIWNELPDLFSRKFHRYASRIYLALFILIFIYWMATTWSQRGSIFYTVHGKFALAVVILHLAGAVLSLPWFFRNEGAKKFHFGLNFLAYLLFMGTILTGIILAN